MRISYQPIKEKSKEIKNWLTESKYKNLKTVFDTNYFQSVDDQIKSMEKHQNYGPINSMFIFLIDNFKDGSKQIHLFEKYLDLVLSQLSRKKQNKLRGELRGSSSLDSFFEISTLANLLIEVPENKIELFPTTIGKRNVDARLYLVNEWVYLECTVLHESDKDKEQLAELLAGKKTAHYAGSIDPQKGKERYKRKLAEKCDQFAPSLPNVILISTFGFYPVTFVKKLAMHEIELSSISAILDFNRARFSDIYTAGCGTPDQLTTKEKRILKSLFSSPRYKPLVY